MAKVRGRESIEAFALEFMILTASRIGEALGARWEEIDLEAKLWTVPAERMKGGEQHKVPLSSRAVVIVREMAKTRLNEFVFPGMKQGRPLSDSGIRKLVSQLHEATRITRHGFRSSFRDWAAETTSFPEPRGRRWRWRTRYRTPSRPPIARGDLLEKRRKLMEAWASYCQRAPESAKVVPLKRQAV